VTEEKKKKEKDFYSSSIRLGFVANLCGPASECCLRNQRSYIGQTHLKSKGYIYLLKTDKNDLKRFGHPTFIRLSKIRLNSTSFNVSMSEIMFQEKKTTNR